MGGEADEHARTPRDMEDAEVLAPEYTNSKGGSKEDDFRGVSFIESGDPNAADASATLSANKLAATSKSFDKGSQDDSMTQSRASGIGTSTKANRLNRFVVRTGHRSVDPAQEIMKMRQVAKKAHQEAVVMIARES